MKTLLLIVAMLLIVVPAVAGNYSENFEEMTPGQLNANSGLWSQAYSGWQVVANSSVSGTNAISEGSVDSAACAELMCPSYSRGTTFTDGTVASILMTMGSGSQPGFWWNVSNGVRTIGTAGEDYYSSTPFIGLVYGCWGMPLEYASGGYGWTEYSGSYSFVTGDVYRLSAALDFTDQTVAYSIQDLTNSTNNLSFSTPFGYATTTGQAAGGNFYIGGGAVEFDNLAVTTVPEPSALVALATGLMGICGFSIRRRK